MRAKKEAPPKVAVDWDQPLPGTTVMPTPAVAFLTRHLSADAGIVIRPFDLIRRRDWSKDAAQRRRGG